MYLSLLWSITKCYIVPVKYKKVLTVNIHFQITHSNNVLIDVCDVSGLTNQTTIWDGVVVSPLDKAYEKPPENKEGEDDMDADGDEAMETTDT